MQRTRQTDPLSFNGRNHNPFQVIIFMHYILFIIVSSIWGSSFILMKKAGLAFGPLTIAALGTLGGGFVLWIPHLFRKTEWKIRRNHLLPLLAVSLLGYIWPFSVQPFVIQRIGHGFVGVMVSFVPLLTIVASIPILKVHPTRLQLFGVVIGLFCIGLVVADGIDRRAAPQLVLLALTVPAFYAISNSMIRKIFQDIPSLQLVAVLMTGSGLALAPLAFSIEEVAFDESFLTAVRAMTILAIFGRGVASLLFYKLIKDKGPLFAGMVTYLIPLGALLWSWLDNEQVTLKQIIATGVVVLVVAVVQRDVVRHTKHITEGSEAPS